MLYYQIIKYRKKIYDIQKKNELSNRQTAGLLDITETELAGILSGKTLPDIDIIINMKQNFKISTDWLLFGE